MGTNHSALLQQKKIAGLLSQRIITEEDYNNLTDKEKDIFEAEKDRLIGELKGAELSAFIEKISLLLPGDVNDEIWESNHDKICAAINNMLQTCNRMPSISEIAKAAGLSRVTVRKHLSEPGKNDILEEREMRYRYMKQTILTALYNRCIHGDVNAMRFYFEVTGLISKGNNNSIIANQHNYIQINNLKLSQEEIQKLSPEQLKQIEAIVKHNRIV